MQSDETIEVVGKMRPPFRLADAEGLLLAIVSLYQVVDAGEQRTEWFAIVDDAANGNSTKTDTVIAAHTTDQTHARGIAAHVVIGERDLERCVDSLRSGVAEKYVIEVSRGERGNPARELECLGVAELECRRVVQRSRLTLNRFNDRRAIVARVRAPEAGCAIHQPASVAGDVMHVFGDNDHLWPLLEGAVGGKRHPIGFKIVGNGDFCLCLGCCHDWYPLGCRAG